MLGRDYLGVGYVKPVATKVAKMYAFVAKIEASDQRFFQDSYSFTWCY